LKLLFCGDLQFFEISKMKQKYYTNNSFLSILGFFFSISIKMVLIASAKARAVKVL